MGNISGPPGQTQCLLGLGRHNNSNETPYTAVTIAAVLSKERVEEVQMAGLGWASVQLHFVIALFCGRSLVVHMVLALQGLLCSPKKREIMGLSMNSNKSDNKH